MTLKEAERLTDAACGETGGGNMCHFPKSQIERQLHGEGSDERDCVGARGRHLAGSVQRNGDIAQR